MSLLIGPDTIFTRMGSVLANRAGYCNYLGWAVSLLIGPDNIFTSMGSLLANRAGYYFYMDGKCPC